MRKVIDEAEASGIRSRKVKIFVGARAIAKRRETRRDTE
jgi:hypothetical protein